jgi:hypothetical protein
VNTVNGYVYKTKQGGSRWDGLLGQRASPSDVMIIYDEDDAGPGTGAADRSHEDYPDAGDNHGTEGEHMVFSDGHAAFIKQKDWVGAYIRGTDEPYSYPNL